MDPRRNPYTPNAGARPPVLAGRSDELATFDLLLDRLQAGYTEQSMIITGLRGVGKTVLLGEFRSRAEQADWAVVEFEVAKHDDNAFGLILAREIRRALFAIAPSKRWRDKARRAAGALKSFSITIGADGAMTTALNVEALEGFADSGMLESDLSDLLITLGDAAKDHDTGVIFLLDEIQFLSPKQLEALIAAMHKTVQRALPITLVAAGLPQLPELAGEAKSYAERMFKFPEIGSLSASDAKQAITEPAANEGASFEEEAVARIYNYTEGYPYFVQEFGKAAWDLADGPSITATDVEQAQKEVEEKLDSSFFRVRLDRTTDLERAYLRAMAELGPTAQAAGEVASLLDRTSQQCGPTRKRLIEKGLLYTPNWGYAAFTVPQFDRYLKRQIPGLIVPLVRQRSSSA
jgi:hypothetical protein